MTAHPVELADIIRQHGQAFLDRYGARIPWVHLRALIDIARCRTRAMGGHVEVCSDCGLLRNDYNSCRNRHCPKCMGSARRRWAAAREAELLPVPYFHVVFTLPSEIAALSMGDRRLLYDILFKSAAATLTQVAADPAHLGARIGFVAVLHTWGQKLDLHPHLHCLVPGGGLSPDGTRWVSPPDGFFLPVRVLSRVFRGKFLASLRAAERNGLLSYRGDRRAFARRLDRASRREWVVYCKPPFGGPQAVVRYLARYTHRVAISNRRIVSVVDGQVTFRYKDYADGNQIKTMTLDAVEFLRRFLMHVLPPGFTRIRHYGLLANRDRKSRLQQCRAALAGAAVAPLAFPDETAAPAEQVADLEPRTRCPACHAGRMTVLCTYARPFLRPEITAIPTLAWDTS